MVIGAIKADCKDVFNYAHANIFRWHKKTMSISTRSFQTVSMWKCGIIVGMNWPGICDDEGIYWAPYTFPLYNQESQSALDKKEYPFTRCFTNKIDAKIFVLWAFVMHQRQFLPINASVETLFELNPKVDCPVNVKKGAKKGGSKTGSAAGRKKKRTKSTRKAKKMEHMHEDDTIAGFRVFYDSSSSNHPVPYAATVHYKTKGIATFLVDGNGKRVSNLFLSRPFVPARKVQSCSEAMWIHMGIVGHEGKLPAKHGRQRGCSVNVIVRWADNSSTFEPLNRFMKDDPDECYRYAEEKGLLEETVWKGLVPASLRKEPSVLVRCGERPTVKLPDLRTKRKLPTSVPSSKGGVEKIDVSIARKVVKYDRRRERRRRAMEERKLKNPPAPKDTPQYQRFMKQLSGTSANPTADKAVQKMKMKEQQMKKRKSVKRQGGKRKSERSKLGGLITSPFHTMEEGCVVTANALLSDDVTILDEEERMEFVLLDDIDDGDECKLPPGFYFTKEESLSAEELLRTEAVKFQDVAITENTNTLLDPSQPLIFERKEPRVAWPSDCEDQVCRQCTFSDLTRASVSRMVPAPCNENLPLDSPSNTPEAQLLSVKEVEDRKYKDCETPLIDMTPSSIEVTRLKTACCLNPSLAETKPEWVDARDHYPITGNANYHGLSRMDITHLYTLWKQQWHHINGPVRVNVGLQPTRLGQDVWPPRVANKVQESVFREDNVQYTDLVRFTRGFDVNISDDEAGYCCNCMSSCDPSICPCWTTESAECPPHCSRGGGPCGNRRIANGAESKLLQIFPTVQYRSKEIIRNKMVQRGVRSLVEIQEGELIVEYCGMAKPADHPDNPYVLQIKDCGPSPAYNFIIDASVTGNVARYINHSCKKANSVLSIVMVDGLPRAFFSAKQRISIGEEVTFDYRWKAEASTNGIVVFTECNCGSQFMGYQRHRIQEPHVFPSMKQAGQIMVDPEKNESSVVLVEPCAIPENHISCSPNTGGEQKDLSPGSKEPSVDCNDQYRGLKRKSSHDTGTDSRKASRTDQLPAELVPSTRKGRVQVSRAMRLLTGTSGNPWAEQLAVLDSVPIGGSDKPLIPGDKKKNRVHFHLPDDMLYEQPKFCPFYLPIPGATPNAYETIDQGIKHPALCCANIQADGKKGWCFPSMSKGNKTWFNEDDMKRLDPTQEDLHASGATIDLATQWLFRNLFRPSPVLAVPCRLFSYARDARRIGKRALLTAHLYDCLHEAMAGGDAGFFARKVIDITVHDEAHFSKVFVVNAKKVLDRRDQVHHVNPSGLDPAPCILYCNSKPNTTSHNSEKAGFVVRYMLNTWDKEINGSTGSAFNVATLPVFQLNGKCCIGI